MLGKVMDSLSRPSSGMSWVQLAGATVFVIVVAVAWRQVTLLVKGEI